MRLDGNNMIELLSLSKHDKRIVEMLEELGKYSAINESQESTIFVPLENYGAEIMFDSKNCVTKQPTKLHLNQIKLTSQTSIKLPFDLNIGDDYQTVVKKIGQEESYKNKFMNNRLHWDMNDGLKKYKMNINFKSTDLQELEKITLVLAS
ncbi:hypothetical protein [Sulfurimonas sp.]|uniref:hypothetical protein n=1 Tax=Sulfurimonas sp. TaxID=2022749 RepID=UPI003D13E58B